MKRTLLLRFFFVSSLFSVHALAMSRPKDGYVPNAETAIKIAEAIWVPIFGDRVLSKRPFKAVLKNDIWIVEGSLPAGSIGGVPHAEISKMSGEILRISHGQ